MGKAIVIGGKKAGVKRGDGVGNETGVSCNNVGKRSLLLATI